MRNLKIWFLPPPPTLEFLSKDFCLQPGLEWKFLLRRTLRRNRSGQKLLPLQFPEVSLPCLGKPGFLSKKSLCPPRIRWKIVMRPRICKCGFVLLLKGYFRDISVWRWFEPCFEGIWACNPPDVMRMDKRNVANRHQKSRKRSPQKRRLQSCPYRRCGVDTEIPYGLPFKRELCWVLQVRVASGVDTEFPYRVRIIDRGVDCRNPVCCQRSRFPESLGNSASPKPHSYKPHPCNMPQAKTEVALQFSECCAAEVALQHWLFCSADLIFTQKLRCNKWKLHCNIQKSCVAGKWRFPAPSRPYPFAGEIRLIFSQLSVRTRSREQMEPIAVMFAFQHLRSRSKCLYLQCFATSIAVYFRT